jgi:ATP-dependent Clp protease, protease subunit
MSANLKLSSKASAAYAKMNARAAQGELLLHGVVGADFTLATVLSGVRGMGVGSVIRLHSPGGDAHEGLAIYEALKDKGFVVRIDGLAASAASLIAMAGARIVMAPGAQLMLHNPWTFAEGDGDALRKIAETLDKVRDSYIAVYVERTRLERTEIERVMDSETFWSAQEVASLGFGEVARADSSKALALALAACVMD